MIEYESIENKYFYNTNDVDDILELINFGNYYGEFIREKVTKFTSNIKFEK